MRSAPELEPLVDPERLGLYLAENLPGFGEGELQIERHMAGHSNETFFLRAGGGELVLRRPPRGAFLPTAHDVRREYTALSAVAGTPVRAAESVLLFADERVIGAPSYL